jgi:hypothetical protein
MKEKLDPRGCNQRLGGGKQFTVCAKCGHGYIGWFKKYEIEEKNKVLKQTFDRNLVEYNKKKKTAGKGGKGLKKPTVEQTSLFIPCNCHQYFYSGYSNTCPNNCVDGSCKLCNCSCSFVVSTSNYCTVHVTSVNARVQPRKSDGDVENACNFLEMGA